MMNLPFAMIAFIEEFITLDCSRAQAGRALREVSMAAPKQLHLPVSRHMLIKPHMI